MAEAAAKEVQRREEEASWRRQQRLDPAAEAADPGVGVVGEGKEEEAEAEEAADHEGESGELKANLRLCLQQNGFSGKVLGEVDQVVAWHNASRERLLKEAEAFKIQVACTHLSRRYALEEVARTACVVPVRKESESVCRSNLTNLTLCLQLKAKEEEVDAERLDALQSGNKVASFGDMMRKRAARG